MISKPARRRWAIAAGIIIGMVVLIAVVAAISASALNRSLRSRMESALASHFQGDITFQQFDATVFPHFHLNAAGMVVRRKDDSDLPPLVEAMRLEGDGPSLLLLMGHIRQLKIEGLSLNIPVGRARSAPASRQAEHFPVVIDRITSDGAHLEILRTKSEKPPLQFDIRHLEMTSVNLDQPSPFHATLLNPEPRGEIETNGKFGPWNGEEPSATPVSGSYTFSHADLATFNGLGGILSSTGKYTGVLRQIDVQGEADVPGFELTMAHHPLPLHTSFHATVDGTNGNTTLQSVSGNLKSTPISASGEITKVQDAQGRRILLDGSVTGGRLEDVLQLVVRSTPPPLSGSVSLHTQIDLPPGNEDVIKRLRLAGDFAIHSARFSSINIREKLESLSRRAKGMPEETSAGSSITNMKGSFTLDSGAATFSNLMFGVDGASLQLAGRYELPNERMDFHGKLLMDAELSQTTTGLKAFFLKALNPLFRKKDGNGSEIPISISGTRSSPSFGLDIGKKF